MLMATASTASADPEVHKVFVCKYVGEPGDDERLQTGNNPISTDTHYLSELDWTELGCAVARRAWIGPGQVLNTRSLEELLAWTRRG